MVHKMVTILALVCVAAAGTLGVEPAAAQPAPPVYAYPVLYRLDHGRWERSLVFELGDRVRFVMPFLTVQRGWSFPLGSFRVQRERVPFYKQPVIFQQTMTRKRGAHGYTIFSV